MAGHLEGEALYYFYLAPSTLKTQLKFVRCGVPPDCAPVSSGVCVSRVLVDSRATHAQLQAVLLMLLLATIVNCAVYYALCEHGWVWLVFIRD